VPHAAKPPAHCINDQQRQHTMSNAAGLLSANPAATTACEPRQDLSTITFSGHGATGCGDAEQRQQTRPAPRAAARSVTSVRPKFGFSLIRSYAWNMPKSVAGRASQQSQLMFRHDGGTFIDHSRPHFNRLAAARIFS